MQLPWMLVLVCAPLLRAASVPVENKELRVGSDALLSTPIMDGHNDLPWNLKSIEGNQLANFNFSANLDETATWNCTSCFTDIPRLRKGRVGAQFWVAYVSCTSQYKDAVEQTLEQIDVIKRLIRAYPDDLQYADSADSIEDAITKGKIASLICVEGGHSIDSRLSVLRLMYELGARYMTLTHSCNTPWADASPTDHGSSTGPPAEHNGITPWGKGLVLELNRLGMMVDLSHVSAQTMRDALNVTLAPVIFSHSSAYAICQHHRNVRDDVLELMPANGGVVMVNFYSRFVQCDATKTATMEDVVAHINHIRNVAGVDHVGIGGDYDGVSEMPDGLEDVSTYPALFDRLANTTGDEPVWTPEDLEKLAGQNLLRVMRAVEKKRDELQASMDPVETWIDVEDLKDNIGCRTDTGIDEVSGSTVLVPVWTLLLALLSVAAFRH